jgi:membrane fusion protein, heavy metal efflux system
MSSISFLHPPPCTTRALLALFVVTLATVGLAACSKPPEAAKAAIPGAKVTADGVTFAKDSPQLTTLRTVEAVLERESYVRINGRVSWDDAKTSRVNSSVSGKVVELKVMPGASVKKGDVLAVISSPEFGQTQSEARRAESDFALSTRALNRAKELHTAGVIPTKELQSAEADFARARAERSRTQVRERSYGGGNKVDQMFRIVAPLGGVIVDRRITIGQEVRSDQGTDSQLFIISDPSNLWISLDVPEALTTEVEIGEAIRVTVPALPGEVFNAKIEYVSDFIDPQSRTVKARASVENNQRHLKAEMYINAEVQVKPSTAVKVPAAAVYLQEATYYAFIEEAPGRFVRRAVRAESAGVGTMRVTSGMKPGDRVIVDGALLLQRMLTQKASAPAEKESENNKGGGMLRPSSRAPESATPIAGGRS